MAALQTQKKALRKAMAVKLRSLSAADIQQQSQAVAERLLASPIFLRSRSVSCYMSMPLGEVQTSALLSATLSSGKTLFVPKIDIASERKMDFLKVYDIEDLRTFPSGTWGIKEPDYEWKGHRPLDEDVGLLDLILVPGVAFDRSLSRLGHGKGYYDHFVSLYTSSKSANSYKKPMLGAFPSVALALREQILEAGEVPTALHDWQMDVIVGPDGILGTTDGPQ
ncbi:hypothetical protein POSPLADRAFT_1146594 [Postia placenta MAD-698-R-SB12]|uniref:5-formyltetrahydrofolate cyclo-ligase n=1 Tax=Postia placenta MAD-698-R-SB12 TaxID=670580 RepID=A0A1X6MX61_9APHY|nr:hypothetical protein POSPLADRAFT_1146594 [Postia placenta MAD-698-R-SB12]OSX60826.1 hypothetical protein POSPLADRAFT_1146594 [Postia placenta MAD-698-R-SB12]